MRATLAAFLLLASPAAAEVPKVVTDIPVVQSLVAQVMGDLGQPDVLVPAGGNAHNYQMRPSDAGHLQDADLVFWIGPAMTPWLERGLASADHAKVVALLDAPGTHRRDFGAAGPDGHDHEGQDHEAESHDHEAEGAHTHEGVDPHAWLDPANARLWLGVIAGELSALDPANAAAYAANATAASAAIAATDTEVAATLAAAPRKPVVMFHDAYGYFAEHYGVEIVSTIALGDAATPGAARLEAIRHQLEHEGVACLFPEAQHDPKLAQTLIEGTPVRLGAPLDPSGSATEPGPDLYQRVLRNLGTGIADCLSGR